MHYVYFPEELIALRQEITYHPDLQVILRTQEVQDIYIHIAEIAAYCGMVLDGDYTPEDVLKLAEVMTQKLQDKRAIIVLPIQ